MSDILQYSMFNKWKYQLNAHITFPVKPMYTIFWDNPRTTSNQSNQLRNLITALWEYMIITTQTGEISYRKSDAITFVVNSSVNINIKNL